MRLVMQRLADGKEAWAKEIGNYVMPASTDEIALWKRVERLEDAVGEALALLEQEGLHGARPAADTLRAALGGVGTKAVKPSTGEPGARQGKRPHPRPVQLGSQGDSAHTPKGAST